MKLAIAGFTVVILAMAAAFVFAYAGNRDTTPDRLTGCIEDLGLGRIISPTALGPAIPDIEGGRLPAVQRTALRGGAFATVLRPADGAYTLLVVTRAAESTGEVLRRVATVPDEQVYVAMAESPPIARALRSCVSDVRA